MISMSYSESAEGVVVTQDRAIREMLKHGVSDFGEQAEGLRFAMLPDLECDRYDAGKLLEWLGY